MGSCGGDEEKDSAPEAKIVTRTVSMVTSPFEKLGLFWSGEVSPDERTVCASIEVVDILRAAGLGYMACHAGT
jgi:hypothetical protein